MRGIEALAANKMESPDSGKFDAASDVINEYNCPITHQQMVDPVVASGKISVC